MDTLFADPALGNRDLQLPRQYQPLRGKRTLGAERRSQHEPVA